VDLDEILCGGDESLVDHGAIFSNTVASSFPKWQTFKFLKLVQRNVLISSEPVCEFELTSAKR
jgi:hypothetical protein